MKNQNLLIKRIMMFLLSLILLLAQNVMHAAADGVNIDGTEETNGLTEDGSYEESDIVNSAEQVEAIMAFAREKARIKSTEYVGDDGKGRCQAFVKDCYENAGIYADSNPWTATEAKDRWMISKDLDNIPIGACVYFDINHVAIYSGNGKIIHHCDGVIKETGLRGDPGYPFIGANPVGWGYQAGYDLYNGEGRKSIALVADQDRVYSGTFKFWAQRKDDDPGHHAQFFVDGVAVTQFLQADSAGWFAFELDTTKYSDGEHVLSVEYCNTKSSFTDTATIRILNKGIEICDTKDGDVFSGKVKIYIKRFESDPEHYLNFYVDNVLVNELVKADSNNYFTIMFDTTQYADGDHVISVKYASSLYAYTDSRKIKIVNKGILIADYKDGDSLCGTVRIYVKRFENDPEHYLNFYVDDDLVKELLKADSNGYFLIEFDTTKFKDGDHKISVKYANSRYSYTDARKIKIVNKGIEISDYKDGDVISGIVRICAKRFENDPEHYLNIYIDDVIVKELLKADSNNNFWAEIDTTKYTDGEHIFSVKYANFHYAYTDSRKLKIVNDNSRTEGVKGDLTGDGEVAMGDVVKAARAVGGYITLTPEEEAAADVTGDGIVAMGDVVKIARYVGGYIDSL